MSGGPTPTPTLAGSLALATVAAGETPAADKKAGVVAVAGAGKAPAPTVEETLGMGRETLDATAGAGLDLGSLGAGLMVAQSPGALSSTLAVKSTPLEVALLPELEPDSTAAVTRVSTSATPTTLSPGAGGFLGPFKRGLERMRAVDALVAARRELGALRDGRVVMVDEAV